MRKVLFAAAVLALPVFLHAQVKLLRHPAYSKGKVAFSYLGDIWIANENGTAAERLTDNAARDQFPRFSPDGSMIAFSSNRDGNYDVFVIPSTGGKPRQLTFHTAADNVVGWTNDGKYVVFSSTRGNGAFPSVATLWQVPVEGGIETPISTDWGSSASFSQDGTKMAFSRHPGVWSRKHYRGSYAVDLWVEDVASKKFTKLGDPDYHGNYLWPMYSGSEIYFVADILPNERTLKQGSPEAMQSVNNIYKISDKPGAKPVQVTRHGDGNLYFPSISADGKTIVYEDNFGIWKLDVASGKSTEIRVDIKADPKENDTELVTLANDAEGFHISPSNRRAAISVHGEIFTIATEKGETQRVTDTSWREQSPRWSPNGKWISYVSDRTGREEVYVSDELGKSVKQLSNVDSDKTGLVWSNDSKWLMYGGSDHTLRRVEVDTGKSEEIASIPAGQIGGAQFSPDGAFVSYSKTDKLSRQHVWIKELATGQEHQVANPDDFLSSNGAKWTPDGKRLLFLGGVSVAAIASTGGRGSSQLYAVSLTPIDKDPNSSDIDTEAQAEAADAAAAPAGRGGRGGAAANPNANVQVKIVWDGLDRRIKQITRMPGSVSSVVPSPDGRTYLFQATGGAAEEGQGPGAGAGPSYYTVSEDGENLTRLNTTIADAGRGGRGGRGGGGGGFGGGNEPQWSRDGRSIYFMQGGSLYSLAIGGGANAGAAASENTPTGGGRGGRGGRGGATATPTAAGSTGAAPRRIDFSVRMVIDIPAERKQVFEEAWRTMKNRYYDAKMHGTNWNAAKDKYEALLPYIGDTEELQNTIMEMIGEINSSHTGISGGTRIPGQPAPERIATRYPGFEMTADPSGYYKVSYVYRKGPADHEYVKLGPGDFILAVNGTQLKTSDNYWKLFNIMPEKKFEFVVNSKPSMDGSWTVTLEPLTTAQQSDLEYARWVDDHAAMVRTLSNGEIGYLHIKAMDAPSLAKFERDLLENQDKKALVIDERFNGGGGIDMELLQILNQRKSYQSTRNRDGIDVSRPARAFFGPMVVLQNERSASDAEMFPDGFRSLGLGKLVGMPTMSAVIGTGSYTLLDGETLRTPGSLVRTAKGEDMENYGVIPDFVVDNTPPDFLTGHDRQVEKAIEVLKTEMK